METNEDQKADALCGDADDMSRFRDYADVDADWFWELDANLRFTIASHRQEGRTSILQQDLLGKTPWEFAAGDPDRDPLWAVFVDKLKRMETFRGFRIALRQNDGGKVHWRLSGKPVIGADGAFLGYRGVATDETAEAMHRLSLSAQSEDYEAAFDLLEEGVAYFDPRDRLIFVNTTFKRMFRASSFSLEPGTSFEQIISQMNVRMIEDGRNIDLSITPGGGAFHIVMGDGRRLNGETRSLVSGNSVMFIHASATTSVPHQSESIGSSTFQRVIDASPQAFFVHQNGEIIHANSAAAKIFGYASNDFIKTALWDLIDPADRLRIKQYERARANGEDAPDEYSLIGLGAGGATLYLKFLVSVGEWNGQDAIQVFIQDRTVEQLAESARSNSELKFRNLIEGSIQGYFVLRDWKILYANASSAKIFGYVFDDFVGLSFLDFVAPEEHAMVEDFRRRRLAGDTNIPDHYELKCIHKDGKLLTIEISVRIIDWDGEPAFQAIMMDITRQKEFEKYLVKAKEDAERADRSKTEFLGNMSHELRTPLNAIIGFSQLIKDQILGAINSHYIDYAGAIHSSGLHLLELVNDLLDVASIENDALNLSEDEVDLVEQAKTSERMLRPRALKADLLISVDTPEQNLFVRGDDRRLKQIFINLANNAIKFTNPGGHVIIRVFKDDNNRAVIQVEDNGIGISPEDQRTIFDPFARVKSAYVTEREGTGLGLPLVSALAELHGGTIELTSSVDTGTIISVFLPAERVIEPKK